MNAKIKIDFNNEKNGKLQFYEKHNEAGELIEYAFLTSKDDEIQYFTQDDDIKTFPKDQLNNFLIGLYNKIAKAKTNSDRIDKKNKTSVVYFNLRMFASNFPLVLLFFVHKGILGTLKYYGINYTKSRTKDRHAFLNVKITQDKNAGFLNIFAKDTFEEYLINGIRKENTRLFPIDEKMLDNPKTMENFFKKYYSLSKYLNLKNAEKNFIDITTKKVLAAKGDPSEFFEVFGKFMPDKIINGKIQSINSLDNVRIRMSESITHLAYKVLQQGISHMKNNSGRYNIKLDIDKNFISKELQASGMLQYTQNINPLAELTLSNKITKTGVGNPKKDQIVLSRRDINKSYFGTISPTTTNEYGGIGLNQTLSNKAIIKDRFGNVLVRPFNNDINGLDMLSATDSLSPFYEYDDTTRRIMGNQQVSQFAQIEHPDEPLIQTGMESMVPHLVSDRFAIKAKEDGKIIRVDNELNVSYKKGEDDFFNLDDIISRTSRGVYLPLKLTPLVKKGENVKKGQLLATTSSLKTGKLAVGKNLVIALMSYRGMNYEDGWAVADSIGKKFKSTLLKRVVIPIDREARLLDYKIELNKDTKPGETLIEYTNTKNENIESLILDANETTQGEATDGTDIGTGRSYENGNIKYLSPGGKIKNINILINSQSIDSQLLIQWKKLNKELSKKMENCRKLVDPVKKMDCQDQINNLKSAVIGNHKLNNEVYDGTIIELFIEYPNPIQNGSKFTLLGSSGGKGTVQYRIPEGMEPIAEKTGLKVEFLPTPMSNISRKNISVVLSIYLGKITYYMNLKVQELILSSQFQKAEELLVTMFTLLDKTPELDMVNSIKAFFKSRNHNEIINIVKNAHPLQRPAFPILVTPFKNKLLMKDIKAAAAYLKIPLNEKVKIMEEDGVLTEREVPVGIAPIAVLEHIPQFMANVRGSVNVKKSTITGQGRSGTKDGNGSVKIGLYDMFGLSFKKSTSLLKELHYMKADNIAASTKLNNSILRTGKMPSQEELDLTDETEKQSKAKKLISTYFIGAMIQPNL